MDGSLIFSRNRPRLLFLAVWLLVLFILFLFDRIWWLRLRDGSFYTGWVLYGSLIGLTLYNLRKKVPFLPLGRTSQWMRFHIYLGWTSGFLFLVHLGFRLPQGLLESSMALLFVLIFFSGFLGLVLSRSLVRRLNWQGEPVIFERIPYVRSRLRERAETWVFLSLKETDSNSLADFYRQNLAEFFAGPRHFWPKLLGANDWLNSIHEKMKAMERYLNQREREILAEMGCLVREKDALDFQYAVQKVLVYWLFFHIPLAYSLLILGLFHGLMATAFAGGY